MTNTPPPTSNNNDDAASPAEPETPVFDEVATDHPERQDAAPAVAEPAGGAPAAETPHTLDPEPVPLVEPAAPEPVTNHSPESDVRAGGIETAQTAAVQEAPVQEAPAETTEAAGYNEHIDEPVAAGAPVAAAVPAALAAPAQPMQTVYVTAPVAPKGKGNRGFGLLFAFLALLAFAFLYVAVTAIVLFSTFGGGFVERLVGFFSTSEFIVPLVVFILAFAILVLLANRAGWWAYVLGSFLVALAVYFGSIGGILLTANVFGMTGDVASDAFWSLAFSPYIIIAGFLAREVTIWFGAAIARRGRKVKERNLEARAAYERELDNQPLGFS